jgi:adenylate cyclase
MTRSEFSKTLLMVLRKSPAVVSVLIAALLVVVILWVRSLGVFQTPDLAVYDMFIGLGAQQQQGDSPIVLVRVTEADIKSRGEWPLTDATLAKALGRLAVDGARVIGLDIYRDLPVPPGSDVLDELLLRDDGIIAVEKIGTPASPGVLPPAVLAGSGRIGFSDVVIDAGGVVRRGLLFLDDGDRVAYGFALQLALRYLRTEGVYPQPGTPDPSWLRLGTVTLAPLEANDGPYSNVDAGGYQVLMDFRDGAAPFVSVSLSQLLDGAAPAGLFRDRIAILGIDAESVKDSFFTPFNIRPGNQRSVPGIVVHAYLVSQLLRAGLAGEQPMKPLSQLLVTLWIVMAGILGCLAGLWLRSFLKLAIVGVAGVLVILATSYVVYNRGWWLPPVPAGIAWFGCAGLVTAYLSAYEHIQRELLMRLFAIHVSDDVADEMWRHREEFTESGRPASRKFVATVLFTDIERFTTVSEKLGPSALMEWLNEYMEAMANRVIEHGGVIDDYYGDAIKANFGVPVPRSTESGMGNDARNALHCALAMQAALTEFNERCAASGLPRLRMRIGICTGEIVAGCLGSSKRMKYTTIGDTVNIAARLESYDKADFRVEGDTADCRTLLAGSTLKYIHKEFLLEHVGELVLRGKEDKVSVYRLIGAARAVATPRLKEVS